MPSFPATDEMILKAANLLANGELVAFPTETVYGLGALATSDIAVAGIFAAKNRPSHNPLIVHFADQNQTTDYAILTPHAKKLADAFWPGPLTLIARQTEQNNLSLLVTAGLETVALRVPGHKTAQRLLCQTQQPIAAPSANRSGHVSATSPEHVENDLGPKVALILDDGPTPHGVESTIVDVSGDAVRLLRPGSITVEMLNAVIGADIAVPSSADTKHISAPERPIAPGQLSSHYAPKAQLRINATTLQDNEALISFGRNPLTTTAASINISPTGDLSEAAANLYSALRTLDSLGVKTIAVMPIPEQGIGMAINDRLKRAAAPR